MILKRPSPREKEATAAGPSSADPPSYQSVQVAEQSAFLDHIVRAEHHRRNTQEDTRDPSPTSAHEVNRLRNFIRYCLAIDYQCDVSAALSAADRAHFATMRTLLKDLASTAATGPLTSAEQQDLAPYFWHTLHEPCAILDIPAEIAIQYVHRFFKYQGTLANYKGAVLHIPQTEGLERFARKLVTDWEIMVPQIIDNVSLRANLYNRIDSSAKIYFKPLSRTDSATELGQVGRWNLEQTAQISIRTAWRGTHQPVYELNQNGRLLVDKKRICTNFDRTSGVKGPAVWLDKAQACMAGLLRRRDQIKAGSIDRESPGGPFCAMPGRWNDGRDRSMWWNVTYHIPELFGGNDLRDYTFA